MPTVESSSLGRAEALIIATTNPGKLEEFRTLLARFPIRVLGLSEVLCEPLRVVEDGATFADNAIKKARAVAQATRMLSLADDSGLQVDALDGRPGVRSARFAHDQATDAENNAALIAALAAAPTAGVHTAAVSFRARFRCALALVDPLAGLEAPRTVEGVCEGSVICEPRGGGGFGYDPLFVVAGTDRTMAELTPQEKNRLSHRARAFAALRPVLDQVLRARANLRV